MESGHQPGKVWPPKQVRVGPLARRRIKGLALRSIKWGASCVDSVVRPKAGVVLLCYHRVGDHDNEITLPRALFEDQMAWLAESGRVVTFGESISLLSQPSQLDHCPVVLTFDDGTRDFAEVVVPVLERHRLPALLYLCTKNVEEHLPYDDGSLPLSWGAVREAVRFGRVSIGSHTHSHAILNRLPVNAVQSELDLSLNLVQDRLGIPVADFAYPKAVPPRPSVERLVRSRFRSAALGGGRPNVPGVTDIHRLARTFIQRTDGWGWFLRKAEGGLSREDAARRMWDRYRYAATTQ